MSIYTYAQRKRSGDSDDTISHEIYVDDCSRVGFKNSVDHTILASSVSEIDWLIGGLRRARLVLSAINKKRRASDETVLVTLKLRPRDKHAGLVWTRAEVNREEWYAMSVEEREQWARDIVAQDMDIALEVSGDETIHL